MADRIVPRSMDVPPDAWQPGSEGSLRGIAATFDSLLRSTSEGFCVIEMLADGQGHPDDFRFIEVNGAFERQTGMRDVKGRTARELLPELEGAWLERYGRIARVGRPERWEDEVAELGRWFDVYAWRVGRSRDRLVAVSFRDITERKRADERTRASSETFRRLVEDSPFGVYVVDADFRLSMVSAGAQKVFQNVRPLIGRDFDEVLRVIWPEPAASEFVARFRHTLATGEPFRSPTTVEQRADIGETEAYDWKIERIVIPDGRHGVVCHFYDWSEREHAEKALRESEERFRAMADGTPVMIWVDGPHGEVEFINRAYRDFFGVTLEQVQEDSWWSALHPDDLETYAAAFQAALRDQAPFHATARVMNASGEWRWIESHGAPRFAPDDRFLGIVGSSLDITDRQLVEAELRKALAAKDEFLGFVSHELRTPMTVILGMGRVLMRKLDDGEAKEIAADIATSAEELNDLIDYLLLLARLEDDRGGQAGSPSHLGRVIERVLDRQRTRDTSREYRYRSEASGPVVDGEETWLERVLVNLVGNAAKYSPPGRPVTVVLEDARHEVRVRVLDEGDGLKADEVERLFEPFFRGSTHDGRVPGAGLGLAVCKRIVESMAGRMWARPRAEGGAEFGFAVPPLSVEALQEAPGQGHP
jgi:PAS domain S-box-containing protein